MRVKETVFYWKSILHTTLEPPLLLMLVVVHCQWNPSCLTALRLKLVGDAFPGAIPTLAPGLSDVWPGFCQKEIHGVLGRRESVYLLLQLEWEMISVISCNQERKG